MTKREIILSIKTQNGWTEELIKHYMRKYTKADLIRLSNFAKGIER